MAPQAFCRLLLPFLLLLPAVGCGGPRVAAPAAATLAPGMYDQKIELRKLDDGSSAVVVSNLSTPLIGKMRQLCENGSQAWTDYLVIAVQPSRARQPGDQVTPMLGSYRFVGEELHFTPRFPLAKGLTIEAYFNPDGNLKQVIQDSRLGGFAYNLVTQSFSVAKPTPLEDTKVTGVYPSAATLPENQLKFYLYFSAPMSRGQAYDSIHLFETGGKEVNMPFLEIDEELWDPTGTRFTLFFDPGRIKRELKPRLDLGPVLVEGKSYTLVIDAKWKDAEGNPLKAAFRKTFKVGPPDEQMPDTKTWTIQAPAAGTKEPVIVTFPESLDRGLLERVVTVTNSNGETINGKVEISDFERRWQLTPEQPWQSGTYNLVAETILEDLAGNNLARPFEVDLLKPIQREVTTETVKLPFEVK